MYYKFYFLVEDQSGGKLVEAVMEKLLAERPDVEYECKSFKGIGGLSWKMSASKTKTGKLLNDLAIYLRGFNRKLQYTPSVLVVVLDNDTHNTELFYQELYSVAKRNLITMDHIFCIAVEEMEAWLLGDEQAIMSAYPNAKIKILHSYQQDSICGTWEILANVVYPGGLLKLQKNGENPGRLKSEWAVNIGQYLNLNNNKSPSFQHFLTEITKRIPYSS